METIYQVELQDGKEAVSEVKDHKLKFSSPPNHMVSSCHQCLTKLASDADTPFVPYQAFSKGSSPISKMHYPVIVLKRKSYKQKILKGMQ